MSQEGCKVFLYVYDITRGFARQLSNLFLGKVIDGIWHTGVVVFGNEYYFGGGIQSCPEGQTLYGSPGNVIELGYTNVSKDVFEDFLEDISPRYTVETYNLLQRNCNNFCDEVSQFLCGVSIPDFILKLPEEFMTSPMGPFLRPLIQESVPTLQYDDVPEVPHAWANQVPLASQIPASTPAPSAFMQAAAEEEPENSDALVESDKLGADRALVQEEITSEFAALMAEGDLRAGEAAALAARRVMERHGRDTQLSSQS